MADLHIRCILNGRVITDDPSHIVVDGFFNEGYSEGGSREAGPLLACLHWDESEELMTSTVTLNPTKEIDSVLLEEGFCKKIFREKNHVYSFVSEVYKKFKARLVVVRSQPLHFVFRHPGRTLFVERSDEFITLLGKFVSNCVSSMPDINVTLKSDEQYTVPCTTFCHSFNLSEERLEGRTISAPGTSSPQQQPFADRFTLIEKEMSIQKELIKKLDFVQKEQNKKVTAALIRVFDLMVGDNMSSLTLVEEGTPEGDETCGALVKNNVTEHDIATVRNVIAGDMSPTSGHPGGLGSSIQIGTLVEDNVHGEESTKSTGNQEESSNTDRSKELGITSGFTQSDVRDTNKTKKQSAGRLIENALTYRRSEKEDADSKKLQNRDIVSEDTLVQDRQNEPTNVEPCTDTNAQGKNPSSELPCKGRRKEQNVNQGLASIGGHDLTDMAATMKRDIREKLSKLAKGGSFDITVTKEGSVVRDPFTESIRTMTEYRGLLEDMPGATRFWDGMMGAYEKAMSNVSEGIPKALGLDTVLCLDTSGSISGDAMTELKKTAHELIDGIEEIAEEHSIEENVALVTFGGTARIAHHLTNDYESLRDCIEGLEPRGTSPLLQGLIVALACLTRGGICNFSGVKTPPRIIFITDGLVTVECEEHTQDATGPCGQAKLCVISTISELGNDDFKSAVAGPIVWIPVGNADMSFLKSISSLCKGELVERRNMKRLTRYQLIRRLSSSVLTCVRSEEIDPADFHSKLDVIIDAVANDISIEERDEVEATVREQLCRVEVDLGATHDFNNVVEYSNLPPLGTRVERGPDWRWGNQDSDGPGTVINHGQSEDSLWVRWDNGHSNVYRYGEENAFDVLIADYLPRGVEDNRMDIGVQVERGSHRLDAYQDQDGGPGSIGTVIRIRGHKVKVRWENGETFDYSYGENNRFELKLRDPFSRQQVQAPETNASRCSPGHSSRDTEDDPGGQYVWQRSDDGTKWHNYSEEEDTKLKKEYEQRKTGSCLLTRNAESFRVSFKTNTERSVTNKTTALIRKGYVDK
ncbi:uncharacterized protein [Haliotis cracherodii]|uniref:uncharacterized protein n=1 Tax=Haliotis cracherodii TaxID=6455 RepID=UPI0039E9FE51